MPFCVESFHKGSWKILTFSIKENKNEVDALVDDLNNGVSLDEKKYLIVKEKYRTKRLKSKEAQKIKDTIKNRQVA